MDTNNNSDNGIKLLDAVDVLTSIAETHWEEEISSEIEFKLDNKYRNISWLNNGDNEKAISNIKNIFITILNHLKASYQDQNDRVENVESIKSIMVLVGEAAKKIDKYTNLFHTQKYHSITEIHEFKQLQDFYTKKISKTINEDVLSKWIFSLSHKIFQNKENALLDEKILDAKHVFVDMDSVKNDTEYELFFIRKIDGTRFFSPRLIRNIKLVCDFGLQLSQDKNTDQLIDFSIWIDQWSFGIAKTIASKAKWVLEEYYPLIIHHKEIPFYASIHKAVLALFSASDTSRLIGAGSSKGCLRYLADFQNYLREALESRIYQHLTAFPSQEFTELELAGKRIINELLKQIYENKMANQKLNEYLLSFIQESNAAISQEHKRTVDFPIWSQMACDFSAIQKFFRKSPNGPLNIALDLLEEGNYHTFDPYMQMKLPEILFDLHLSNKEVMVHRLASPTTQEVINQAIMTSEWMSYLRSHSENAGNILLINFQDNTSWKEHARAECIEKLQEASGFQNFLTVVTLPKDTEFYTQDTPYLDDNQLSVFKAHFTNHLFSPHTGFHIPKKLKKEITKEWIEGVFTVINQIFFSNKNVISRESRKNFIEIFYALLELKILEVVQAKNVFLICKDGVDISSAAACIFYILMKMISGHSIVNEELKQLTIKIYKSALIGRQRGMLAERAERMLSAIKAMESAAHDFDEKPFKNRIQAMLAPYFSFDFNASDISL